MTSSASKMAVTVEEEPMRQEMTKARYDNITDH